MQAEFDLQHFCCGPRGCEIEIEYGEKLDLGFGIIINFTYLLKHLM